ncbi:MAG: hypothetical protein AAF529_05935, partial [Pseudomonadota bacterium]
MGEALADEQIVSRSLTTVAGRKVDQDIFTKLVWLLLSFVHWKRKIKTHANALVEAVKDLTERFPQHFDAALDELCRWHYRRKFEAWKIQRTIDLYSTGGVNYNGLNQLRKGVEELD